MDTIPFHWDTLDALQGLRMACLCPNECHETGTFAEYGFVTNLCNVCVCVVHCICFRSKSMTAPPPEYTPRPLKKVLTIYVSENRIYE